MTDKAEVSRERLYKFFELVRDNRYDDALTLIRKNVFSKAAYFSECRSRGLLERDIEYEYHFYDVLDRVIGTLAMTTEDLKAYNTWVLQAVFGKARWGMTWSEVTAIENRDEPSPNYARAYEQANDYIRTELNLMIDKAVDEINHPSHYTQYKGVEVIDITRKLSFNRGNAIKYICRAGFKGEDTEIKDLKKALWYIERTQRSVKEEVKFPDLLSYDEVQMLVGQMPYNRGTAVWNLALAGDLRQKEDIRELEWAKNVSEARFAVLAEIKRLESL